MEKSKLTESKVKSMLIIFFTPRGLLTKNLSWQAKQSIPYATVKFYGNCVEMREDFALNSGGKRTGCCITTTHHLTFLFFTSEFFGQKQHDHHP
jgi:hypothetical protein